MKHIAIIHHAEIDFKSREGEGMIVSNTFEQI
jgi:hypothetical protein